MRKYISLLCYILLLCNSLFFGFLILSSQSTVTDIEEHFLLSQTFSRDLVFLPPDSFLLGFPYLYFIFSLFHYTGTTVIIAGLGFLAVYLFLYFLLFLCQKICTSFNFFSVYSSFLDYQSISFFLSNYL